MTVRCTHGRAGSAGSRPGGVVVFDLYVLCEAAVVALIATVSILAIFTVIMGAG